MLFNNRSNLLQAAVWQIVAHVDITELQRFNGVKTKLAQTEYFNLFRYWLMFVAHWYQYNVCLFLVFSHALVAPTQNMRVFLNSPKYISLCLGPITTGWSSATVFYDFSFTDSKRQLTAKLNHFQRRRIGTVWYFDVSKELSWLSFFKMAQMAQMVSKCSCVLWFGPKPQFSP